MARNAYIGVTYEPLKPVFADNTWEQIICACRNNEVPDTWEIGDQKAMTIGDRDYLIDIIGKHHDTYADGSGTAPLTLQMHACYKQYDHMNISSATTAGGWDGSYMRNTVLHLRLFDLMPTEIQSGIKEVVKYTSAGMSSDEIIASNDKLFLLSEVEITGTNRNSKKGEGNQYAYYVNGGDTLKYVGSTAACWWTRSPQGDQGFSVIWSSGGATASAASNAYGVAFAFCFGGTPILPKARKVKKAYIGSGVPLPNGYSELEYIESTGSQYIDTLIYPDDTFGYKVDMEQIDSVGEQCPLGCMGNDNRFVGVYFTSRETGTSTETVLVGWATLANPFNYPNGFSTNQRVISRCNYMNDRKVVFNGYEVLDITNHHIQGTIENSLYLFNRHFRVGGLFKGRIYNAVISKGDEIYADFIPCVNPNGVVGMYDIVRHLFFSSPNSVAFIAGDAKPGVAHKVKKAYIGDKNGVARLAYEAERGEEQ